MTLISELAAAHALFWARVNAFVYRPPQSFNAQLQQRAFWWGFSQEHSVLLDAQRLERERSTAAAEQARMDEVHESRASRRAEQSETRA